MRTILLLAAMASPPADPPKTDPIAPGVRETQVTGMLIHDRKRTQFRATVIAKEGPTLTLLTAAHCLGQAEVGSPIRISRGDSEAQGRVLGIVRNPNYRPAPSADIPGADNAVARIRLDAVGDFPLDELGTAELAGWAVPDPGGGLLTVQMVDQFGKPHVVKAGNYTNPRWLEWGPSYRPAAGDSGSGVFVVRTAPDGATSVLLIGAVVDRSERGGGASLLHRKDRWVNSATRPPGAAR